MATSGTITGSRGGGSTGPYLKLAWSRIAVDEANNKSQLRLTLSLVADYALNFSASKKGQLNVSTSSVDSASNGGGNTTYSNTSFSYTAGFSGTGTKTLKTLDVWVSHNPNGTFTGHIDSWFDIAITWSGSTVSTLFVEGSFTVDTIPRASDFTAFTLSNSTLNKDTAVTVNYTLGRKSTSFSQDMTLKLGSTTIKSWNTTGTGALTQALTAAEVNSIITNVPNATSGTLTLEMQTKSGTTKIGSVVSRTVAFTLNTAIVPTATALTVAIAGTGRDKTIGQYVQGISKVAASFTRTAGYGASISTSTIVVKRTSDGGNSQTISSNDGKTANALSLSGEYSVTATVTDSRGRTATASTTIKVVAYSTPIITKFTCARDKTTLTVVNCTANVSWSSLGTSNPTSITIVGKSNAGVSTTLYTLNNSTDGAIYATQSYPSQSDINSFTYTITVTDSFGKVATTTSKVGTAFVELSIAKGLGIGVGKVHQSGALDVQGSININGGLDVGALNMNNGNINGANNLSFNDPGVNEGIEWKGGNAWKIFESPDDLTNAAGNLQFVSDDGIRRFAIANGGGIAVLPNVTAGAKYSSIFTGDTNKAKINFPQITGSNDPGFIAHETSALTADINKGVIHLCPSDDNDNANDYVTIHGTNDPETIKLYTGGNIETTGQIVAGLDMFVGNGRVFGSVSGAVGLRASGTNIAYIQGGSVRCTVTGATSYVPCLASAFTVSSQEKNKQEIEGLNGNTLDIIRKADIYKYKLKNEVSGRTTASSRQSEATTHYGLIIGDGYNTPEEVVSDDGEGVELYAMVTISWKAIQEMSVELDSAKERIAILEEDDLKKQAQIDSLEERLRILEDMVSNIGNQKNRR